MKGGGILCDGGDGWMGFLARIGSDPTNQNAFVARNFLLDEGVVQQRFESYRGAAAMADHGTVETWKKAHKAYLRNCVFRQPLGPGLPGRLDPEDEVSCPETFRWLDGSPQFLASDRGIHLVRVEQLEFIADYGEEDAGRVKVWAEELVRSRDGLASRELDRVLATWAKRIEVRPVFAGYLRDVEDLFRDRPEADPPGWADSLRDCPGLAHLDPGEQHRKFDVLVFRYPVSDLPTLAGAPQESSLLVPPTVLDMRHSRAFLPAPRGCLTGHVVDLAGNGGGSEPRREVLHPAVAFKAKHLWRLGTIERPVDWNLLPVARALHIDLVRRASSRLDYAEDTDGDLFS